MFSFGRDTGKEKKDEEEKVEKGEGETVLSALAESNNLSRIVNFGCANNHGWFSSDTRTGKESKQGNVTLLCEAIKKMKNLERLVLAGSYFLTNALCD